MISSIAGLGSKNGNKIALQALLYYFATTFIAVTIGIILVSTIKPGVIKGKDMASIDQITHHDIKVTTTDTFLDVIRYFNIKIKNLM